MPVQLYQEYTHVFIETPSISMEYQYQPLNSDKNEIRLLTLLPSHHSSHGPNSVVRCQTMYNTDSVVIGKTSLPEKPRPLRRSYSWGGYVALSYVWGNPNKTREIFVNEKSVQVTENLESALRILRDKLPMRLGVRLWADALCINQNDVKERSVQVQRMWDIYQNALEVVVWLGEEAEDSWKAVHLIKILSLSWKKDKGKELSTILATNPNFPLASYQMPGAPCGRRQERGRRYQKRERRYHLRSTGPQDPSLFGCWKAFESLMQREYWKRVWVIQELSAGTKETPILCGRSVIFLEDLSNAAIKWVNQYYSTITLLARAEAGGLIKAGNLILAKKFHDVRRHDCWPPPLDVLAEGRDLDSTDPRDKIYGFMALIHPYFVKDLKPNYELPVEQVYTNFCVAVMQAYLSLDFLSHCNWTPDQNTTPSWVPDWNQKPDNGSPFLTVKGEARNSYLAGGPGFYEDIMKFFPVQSPDKKRLKVLCLMTDQIDGLSMNHLFDGSDAQPTQPATQNNHYGHLEGCREALWRTFLCNRDHNSTILRPRDKDAIALMDFPLPQDHRTWTQAEELFYTFIAHNHSFRVAGQPLAKYFTSKIPDCQHNIELRRKQGSREESLLETAVANVCQSRLFTTHMGLVGICPPSVKSGDMVSILLGCSVPLVLRPHGDNFRVIGACYAHGIMEGEFGELFANRKIDRNKIQTIELC
ncbi:uncharacterized protein PAC_19332 [Phialocephala subalpina]|uniref:Heterokaryon incompatibility domain-containing protein n=1 Tax=Phialocephala subalpina TaxID=576137 RepID=A0A1L7XWJ6_9HELO|nr:uncharacterized protein PAC_19332 [Phialocephala subalpina]